MSIIKYLFIIKMGNCTSYVNNGWKPVYYNEWKKWENIEKERRARLNTSTTVVNNIIKDINEVNQIYADVRQAARNFSKTDLRDNIQRYINSPVSDFIKSFDPSYISNNNTIYLKLTAFDNATRTTITLDDSFVSYTKPAQSIYDVIDEDTTYEDMAYIDDFDADDYFYEPEGGNLKLSEDADSFAKVILFNNKNMILRAYNEYTTYNYIKDVQLTEDSIINSLEITPGTKVTVMNGKGVRVTYDNSPQATTSKKINLDSSMLAKNLASYKTYTDIFNDIVTTVTVSRY